MRRVINVCTRSSSSSVPVRPLAEAQNCALPPALRSLKARGGHATHFLLNVTVFEWHCGHWNAPWDLLLSWCRSGSTGPLQFMQTGWSWSSGCVSITPADSSFRGDCGRVGAGGAAAGGGAPSADDAGPTSPIKAPISRSKLNSTGGAAPAYCCGPPAVGSFAGSSFFGVLYLDQNLSPWAFSCAIFCQQFASLQPPPLPSPLSPLPHSHIIIIIKFNTGGE